MAAGHMGVIVQLAESCAESEERQDELMQCLLRVGQPNAQRVLLGWDDMLFSRFHASMTFWMPIRLKLRFSDIADFLDFFILHL